MELLQFIIISTSYLFMSANKFFECAFIFLFFKINYENRTLEYNPHDHISVLMNLINMTIHYTVYQMVIIVKVIKQYNFGNSVICTYDKINFKFIELKNNLINYIIFSPIKFIMKKLLWYLLNNKLKFNSPSAFISTTTPTSRLHKTNMNPCVKLETNQDINNFLDGLLDGT